MKTEEKSEIMNTESLIPLVYAKPEVWDQSHKLYSSKEKKQRAWQYIGEQLSVTGNEAKLRWTSLRDLFRRELKKTLNMARMTGDPEAYVPRWRHFRSMLFLKDQIVKDGEDLELPALAFHESASKLTGPYGEEDEECLDMEDEFYGEYSSGSHPNYAEMAVAPPNTGRKRSARSVFNDYDRVPRGSDKRGDRVAQENSVYLEATAGCSANGLDNETDEDYHFVMSILGSVRRIRPDRKTLFKVKVLQLILDEENCPLGKSEGA